MRMIESSLKKVNQLHICVLFAIVQSGIQPMVVCSNLLYKVA